MKALITGGAGFIGSHLAEELLENGKSVIAIDNLSTGSMDNIKHLKSNPKFEFVLDTIMDRNIMKKLISKVDVVYHLAAAVGVKYIIDNPLLSLETNIKGTEIILELSNELGKKKVILASTSEIYGKDRSGKSSFKENDDRLLGPTTISRWSYSCAKAVDEFLALAYFREKKLPIVIVRFFNICGPRQSGRYGMVMPRFIKQSLMNQPITIFGGGDQTRSFTYVKDAVDGLVKLATNPKAVGEVFNIGNPRSISIKELAEKIKKFTNSRSELSFIPYEKAYEKGFEDMKHRTPDITKIKKLIDFNPKVDIDEMIKLIIDDFKK